MTEKTPEPKELFRVIGTTKRQVFNEQTKKYATITEVEKEPRLMTKEDIDSSIKWASVMAFVPQSWESIGTPWPEKTTVEKTWSGDRGYRCYQEAHYLVKSPRELTDFDWQVLHANHMFMGGQMCGQVVKTTKTHDGVEYVCHSVCDSSD